MRFAKRGLRGNEMALVGAPAIGREAGDGQRRSELVELEKHLIFAAPQDIRHPSPTVMSTRMP
jgi:hypothetical protein